MSAWTKLLERLLGTGPRPVRKPSRRGSPLQLEELESRLAPAFTIHAVDHFDTSKWEQYSTRSGWSSQLVSDFNGDEKDDVASFHPGNGTWWVSLSNGTGYDTRRWADFTTNSGWKKHVVGDFNNDGRDDIASFHPGNGTWWVSLSTGTKFNVRRWADFTTNAGWTSQVVGDFNADGRDDIANFHPGNGTWWVCLSTGTGFRVQRWADFPTNSGWTAQLVGDFNGDGRDDIANFHPANGNWFVSLSTGKTFKTVKWADYTTNSGWSKHLVGDFNDDGKDDIASFHPGNGTWWVSLSNGKKFATKRWADYSTNSGWTTQIVGDFNGDDRADIANFHPGNGTWWLSLSTGTGFETRRWADLTTNSGWGSQLAGDFNGDGRADVAGFHPGNGTWWVGLSAFGKNAISNLDAGGLDAPGAFAVKQEIPVLDRLARFEQGANPTPSVAQWKTVAANDANLTGKNIYVAVHGWAPGYIDMVKANSTPGNPLKWWQTLDTSLPKSPGTPASPYLFQKQEEDDVVISPNGLAQSIMAADPNAVVLAYSWIVDSATANTFFNSIPTGAYLSEAYTYMNGQRLAKAIEQAVGSGNLAGARIHLIGHSHGSKVVTVATLALHQAGKDIQQLTILDSPEGKASGALDANNFNYFYLGGLNMARTAGTTFVDHYISEFDITYGDIQGVDPFNPDNTVGKLQEIVDVTLDPLLFGLTDLGGKHGYAFSWYAGASQTWAQNPTPTTGNTWSPLLNPGTPATLSDNYTQSWTEKTDPQFALTAGADPNSATEILDFSDISFSKTKISSGSAFVGDTITLKETAAGTATFTGEFRPDLLIRGVSFQFQFTNMGDGDQLVISVDTGTGFVQQLHFVMTGTVVGTTPQTATLSLGSLAASVFKHTIKVELVSTGAHTAVVEVKNFQQYEFEIF